MNMKSTWIALWLMILIAPSFTFASVNNKPQFEFGTIPSSQCEVLGPVVSCNIKFENTYSSPPLVFVMSTINPSRSNFFTKTTELPSDLRVWSVSTVQATIKQRLSPHAKKCNRLIYNEKSEKWQCTNNSDGTKVNFIDAPMENIDYLVIEEGVLEFDNGAKIVAGLLSTQTTISGKKGGGGGTSVSFGAYGLTSNFNEAPGVLVQLQSRNNETGNQPLWLTASAKDLKKNGFTALLERSEITNNAVLPNPEEVAFVAGLGEGFVNGRKFWLGQGATQNTLSLDDKVIKPITEGCQQVINFTETGFKKVPTLIASKSARNGPNGGWLRRCSVSKTGVALINEEDMQKDPERSHTLEPFSYFLFDKPETAGICRLFPSPAQTWNGNQDALLEIGNTANISGAPISNGRRYLGFSQSDILDNKRRGCDGSECFGDTGLKVERPQLESFQTPDSGLEVVTVGKRQSRTFQNNESIGRLSIDKQGVAKFKTGTYWIDSINVNGDIEIPNGEVVEIHTKGFALSNGSTFSELGTGQLIVYVHGLAYNNSEIHNWVNLANNSQFIGLLYSEKDVILSNNALVEGAVTAKKIKLNNGSQIIASNQCFEPADDYKLTLSPESDLALMCGDDTPVFTVNTTNNNVAESLSVGIEVIPDANNFNIEALPSFGTGYYPDFKSNSSGILKLKVTPKDPDQIDLSADYQLVATLKDDTNQYARSQFKFVPFKFDVNDLAVIAGKVTNNVVAKVLACDDSEQLVAKSYTGTPSISHEVQSPNSSVASKGALNYTPVFEVEDEGVSEDKLIISESGEFLVNLYDRFNCAGYIGCPLNGYYDLDGSFTIKSRPWKIAICDVVQASNRTNSNPATTSTGTGFMPAGELFSVTYKPIVHSDSKGSAADECEYPLTTNYSLDKGPVTLSHSVAYPTPSSFPVNIGILTPSSMTHFDSKSSVKIVNHVWSEVGSIEFQTTARYLDMDVDVDSQTIGRFYPKFFKTVNTPVWDYPNEQTFAYMNQPFNGVTYDVEALNAKEESLLNYAYFDRPLTANFALFEPDFSVRFNAPTPSKSWALNNSRSIGTFTLHNERPTTDCESELCWEKAETLEGYEDGPFNTTGGVSSNISITDAGLSNADPVEYLSTTGGIDPRVLSSQPDIRFGRAVIDSVGGAVDNGQRIPLRLEYWNGTHFVMNSDDSTTHIAGLNVVSSNKSIWVESGKVAADVTLDNGGRVDNGESNTIIASQSAPIKQQTQVWLELERGSNVAPWLRYRWDDDYRPEVNGEEDPSTIITFGIYRGNDRIIFRGEPRLFAH